MHIDLSHQLFGHLLMPLRAFGSICLIKCIVFQVAALVDLRLLKLDLLSNRFIHVHLCTAVSIEICLLHTPGRNFTLKGRAQGQVKVGATPGAFKNPCGKKSIRRSHGVSETCRKSSVTGIALASSIICGIRLGLCPWGLGGPRCPNVERGGGGLGSGAAMPEEGFHICPVVSGIFPRLNSVLWPLYSLCSPKRVKHMTAVTCSFFVGSSFLVH